MPLILRGARQVGKTFLMEAFAKQQFANSLTLNFESQPRFKQCFDSLDPDEIVRQIELASNHKIIPTNAFVSR